MTGQPGMTLNLLGMLLNLVVQEHNVGEIYTMGGIEDGIEGMEAGPNQVYQSKYWGKEI